MKKLIALLTVGMLVLTGCSGKGGAPAGGATYKIGTGIVTGVRNSDVGEKPGKFESNVTYATVALEGDKIAFVSIDTNQNELTFTADAINAFVAKGTKKELGKDYRMNWDEQIAKLEEYLVGKTLAEVKAETAATDLTSTVSITIDGYIEAVQLAAEAAVEVKNVAKIAQTSTVSADVSKAPAVEINTVVSVVALDADGKIVHSFLDEAQLKATIEGGKVTPDANGKTKGQLKEAYGMSGAGKVEWYKQVQTLTEWTIGRTAADLAKVQDYADVTSKVSIYTGNLVSTLEKAIKEAKAVK